MRSAGAGGALRIVLVGRRDAEVRADPVALVRLHGAAVLARPRGSSSSRTRRRATFTSSGASRSPSAVEPTMSAKRTVTGRRSSSIVRAAAVGPELGDRPPPGAGAAEPDRATRPVAGSPARDRGARRSAPARARRSRTPRKRAVRLEGVGLPARAIEGDHELSAEPLVERMEAHERLELADARRPGALARASPRIGFERLQAKSFEAVISA